MIMEIKLYEDKYRDDMIFMVLQAKDTLGRLPSINEDLLEYISLLRRNSGLNPILSIQSTDTLSTSFGI